MKKKIITTAVFILLVAVVLFIFLKFFLNTISALVAAFVIVVALTILIFRFLKKKDFIDDYGDFFEENWTVVLTIGLFGWLGLVVLFLYIEDIPPERTLETIQAQRLPDNKSVERTSCDSVRILIEHDVSLDTVKHYRYNWGVMRNHDDTIVHKAPSFAYTSLGQAYSLMSDTVVDGYELKCGEEMLVDVQRKYFEGGKSKPFTRYIIAAYNENGLKKFSKFENEPQSENSNLYDLFFDGAVALWYDTINEPRFKCYLPNTTTTIIQKIEYVLGFESYTDDAYQSNGYSTQEETYAVCNAVCEKLAKNLLGEFKYAEYNACLSTIEVSHYNERIERSCGVAKITVNRKLGFLSRRPYSCNSTGIWKMERKMVAE